jgi:seryl-tRNA synthetase
VPNYSRSTDTERDTWVRVDFDTPLDARHCEDLARFVFFVDESITNFRLVNGSGRGYRAIDLLVDRSDAPHVEALNGKFRRILADDISKRVDIPKKQLWELPGNGRDVTDVFADLLDSDAAFKAAVGQVAIGGSLLKMFRYFDSRLRRLVVSEHGAVEYRYPTLLATSVMERCGYFDSFPQFVMFVAHLHGDIDSYEQFADLHARGADVAHYALDMAGGADHCLPPTMCFHTYHQYAGRQLPATGTVVTSRGKSFRHESRYEWGLERLWDFTIREIVLLGSRDFVRATRARLLEQVRDLLAELDLAGHCEVANDPFFLGTDRGTRMAVQALAESKYELRMPVGGGRTIAAASFNYADDFFTGRFDIRLDDGSPPRSGCVGFGLERLAYAFLCQHGLDERDWPRAVAGFTG